MDNRNPVACGVDGDHDIVRGGDPVLRAEASLLRHRGSGLEGKRAAIRHRVARDDRKIENRRHEQVGIDKDKRGFGGPPRINLDVLAQRGRSRRAASTSSALTSTGRGRDGWLCANASRFEVMLAPRAAASAISPATAARSARSATASCRISIVPLMTVRMLLK